MKLVLVEWLDAITAHSGWKDIDEVRKNKPPLVKSVGWVVSKSPNHITLCASIVGKDVDGDVTVPMGMVRKITELCPRK